MKGAHAETKLFTHEMAEKMLPLVRAIVRDIVEATKALRVKIDLLNDGRAGLKPDSGRDAVEAVDRLEAEVDGLSRKLDACVAELNDLGVELKDYDNGLCDFPSRRDGKGVYLCWLLGEEHVVYWHPLQSGFSGRKPISGESVPGSGPIPV